MDKDCFCDKCGAKVVEYKHSLSKGLLRCLFRMAQAGGVPVRISTLKLTHAQQANFQKLRYWNVVAKVDISDDGTAIQKDGVWKLTDLGWDFIREKIRLPKSVWTYRADVVRYDGEEILFSEVTDGYKFREQYVEDAVAHMI